MDLGEIKDEYRARVEPRGKSISEILEEAAKETKAYKQLEKENKKLNEFKEKREESMFYFKAQMERAEPKTAREAEDLQRAKEIFEKLYREELSCLEEENKTLKDNVEFLHSCLDDRDKSIAIMQEGNDKLKIHIEAKDKAYMDLLADYNYLKARIKKTERAFIKYKEKLEKLEVDLDMVVMNR